MALGIPSAAADETEGGGGGEPPPTVETPAEPPPTEAEPPPSETTTPSEPETTTESPGTTTESPSHPTETTSEATSPAAAAPSAPGSTPTSSPAATSPARHHSAAKGGGSSHPAGQKSGGGGSTGGGGIRIPDPLKSVGSSVNSLFTSALPPKQIEKVGELLAESGLAPRGNKPAQRRAARKIIGALGSAGLGAALSLSPPKPQAAPEPIPFVPIHGGPKYLYLALLALLLGGVGVVLFYQLRPVIRSRQPRPPLISSLDAEPASGAGPGRVSLPRDPARAPDRPNPGRRKTR